MALEYVLKQEYLISEWNFCPRFSCFFVVFSSCAPFLVLAQLSVELWCIKLYGTNLAEKKPFMHLLLPICCSSTSFQVVASENLCSSTVGGTDWGWVEEEEMWLKHGLRNPKPVITPSWTAFSSDTGYSDYLVWHLRRIQFSESINHSSPARNEAQGKCFRLGKIAHYYCK